MEAGRSHKLSNGDHEAPSDGYSPANSSSQKHQFIFQTMKPRIFEAGMKPKSHPGSLVEVSF